MSTSVYVPEDPHDAGYPKTDGRRGGRVQWEIQELASAGILLALTILALSDLASGWAISSTHSGAPVSEIWHSFLLYSTDWSGVFAGFLILVALGLIWRQTGGWVERLEELDGEEEAQATLNECEVAVQHLVRNRSLSTACLVLLIVGLVAAVGSVVGEAIVGYGQSGVFWSQVLRPVGELCGFLILGAIGLVAIVRLHTTYDLALSTDALKGSAEGES
jgi:hypothetical protein